MNPPGIAEAGDEQSSVDCTIEMVEAEPSHMPQVFRVDRPPASENSVCRKEVSDKLKNLLIQKKTGAEKIRL